MSDAGGDECREGEKRIVEGFSARLRRALGEPLTNWREVYESFAPIDLETGERRPRVPEPEENYRRAAVLMPIAFSLEGARIVYTLRKDHLTDHGGQVSFPGGTSEPDDESLLETALREAEEEVNLGPDLVEVVGELEEMYIPPSRFLVSPFVGLLSRETELSLAPEEVEAVFSVSLEELMSPEVLEKVVWERDGSLYEVPIFAVGGYEIWGATAAMTAGLLARLGWKGRAA
ncbi:MAG: CoA pyrophosphatase [Actinomycetota bacterium]|nr:CoA pyrophosphatase [Actinomycetota bacterium]